ncbi:hypothetical protein QE380_000193 [Acinetobacter baylyi]|uniref:Uncharacterized protein n=1 Tax=Acinetobacter baylyi TaxID=202950 RepID=A0ABU0URU7_ACIBI|nr:hypothetical protein [Acinetobacter baylyi]MDQ1207270.1 hypothetical protein [Acinetobacter baylyi]MDR6105648.1 hypothetical protein [Acinetobacter baylyi]MDR6187631.1 hypothetical protein [Acinetobacter baylyi]
MTFITEQEALDNVEGFGALSTSDKAQYLNQSEAYLIARNVKPYNDTNEVPAPLKNASYEVIKGLMKGVIYVNKDQAIKRKKVKAGTVESEKEYQDGSTAITGLEQYILDLIKPYTKRTSVQYLKRI